jgi:hypothetical protein
MFRDTPGVHSRIRDRIGTELDGRVAEICGEFGVLDFLRYYLWRELLREQKGYKSGPLTNTESYSDTLETAKTIVAAIERLPQKLRIASPLPLSYSKVLFFGEEDLQMGNGVIAEFKSLYDVRSQIVHRGLHQADHKVEAASLSARTLARRVLMQELRIAG